MNNAFWNDRWRDTDDKYEASWAGDPHIRILELMIVYDWLGTSMASSLVEVGCGAYTLDEYPPLGKLIDNIQYFGTDLSHEAIDRARRTCGKGSKAFRVTPAEDVLLDQWTMDCTNVLCRRVMQNMGRMERGMLIDALASLRHGLIIECTQPGLMRCNVLRKRKNLDPIPEPAFNDYLTIAECRRISDITGVKPSYPLSTYLCYTRAVPKRTTAGDICAFLDQVEQNAYTSVTPVGPLTVWRW